MFCHRPWVRRTCILLVFLTAALIVPGRVHAQPPALVASEPAGFLDILWTWIRSFWGAEGWGMDPNGGRAAIRMDMPPNGADCLP
jgi:hypothetical protein